MANEPDLEIRQFLGVMNRERPENLPFGALASAINVDIDDTKRVENRVGYTGIDGLNGEVRSIYATMDESRLFAVLDNNLLDIRSLTPLAYVQMAVLSGSGEIYWAEAGNRVYYCGEDRGVIENRSHKAFGIPTPDAPYLRAIGGALPAGRYQVTITLMDDDGREGGAPPPSEIELHGLGGIAVTLGDLQGYRARIWASSLDGESLYLLCETDESNYNWISGLSHTYPLPDVQLVSFPPPDGARQIAYFASRLWVAEHDQSQDVSFIYSSEPFFYHLFKLADFVPVPGEIRFIAGTEQGLIIGTDRNIYAHNGEVLAELADFGVPRGTPYVALDRRTYFWADKGLCRGLPFELITDPHYSAPVAEFAGLGAIEQRGRKMIVAALTNIGDADNGY